MPNITILAADAEHIFQLYWNVETADAHYRRCQSDYFRNHVQSIYRGAQTAEAFARLKEQLDSLKAQEASKAASKASKASVKKDEE